MVCYHMKNHRHQKPSDPEKAIQIAKSMAGLKKFQVVVYQHPYDYKSNIYATGIESTTPQPLIDMQLPQWLQAQGPQFLYLWTGFDLE